MNNINKSVEDHVLAFYEHSIAMINGAAGPGAAAPWTRLNNDALGRTYDSSSIEGVLFSEERENPEQTHILLSLIDQHMRK